jgi:hypothetical protein
MHVKANRWPGCARGGWLGLVFAMAILGCKGEPPPKGVSIVLTGKLTRGGQPFSAGAPSASYARVEVRLISATGSILCSANVAADGTFQVVTPNGAPVPPGKYRVAVFKWNQMGNQDELGGKYDETNSPITREIKGDQKVLEIDLDKP